MSGKYYVLAQMKRCIIFQIKQLHFSGVTVITYSSSLDFWHSEMLPKGLTLPSKGLTGAVRSGISFPRHMLLKG